MCGLLRSHSSIPRAHPSKLAFRYFPFLFVRSQPKEGRSIAIQIHEPVHGDHHANENQDHPRRDFYLARMGLEPLQEPTDLVEAEEQEQNPLAERGRGRHQAKNGAQNEASTSMHCEMGPVEGLESVLRGSEMW
jgi:hypothetical protein